MNYTMTKTDPRKFGAYEVQTWPMWWFYASIAATIFFIFFATPLAFISVVFVFALMVKPGYFSGLADATETPVAPTIGQANIRATYTRRVVTYRPFLLLPFIRGRSATQLLVFIAVSELAKARMRSARTWNNVLYIYKYSGMSEHSFDNEYRLRDIVEKGPLIIEKVDVNELNVIEDDIRTAVDNLARHVKNLSEDQAHSSTDTVEY
jgi:hypothetical protein